MAWNEGRDYPRLKAGSLISVRPLEATSGETLVSTKVMGLGGLMFETDSLFEPGQILELSLLAGADLVPITVRVVWSTKAPDGRHQVGVEFLDISDGDRTQILDAMLRRVELEEQAERSHGGRKMRVLPAVLAADEGDFRSKVALVSSFTDYAQLDFMDGHFVPSHSIPATALAGLSFGMDCEAHLMVQDPLVWLGQMDLSRVKTAIFHLEAVDDPTAVAAAIRGLGPVPGLALNPATTVAEAMRVLPLVDVVLVMAVHPGFYGAKFLPETLGKAHELRHAKPGLTIGIDGGVALDNLGLIREAGFDYVCVGSRIVMDPDPAGSYARFVAAAS